MVLDIRACEREKEDTIEQEHIKRKVEKIRAMQEKH
jgi:hypothetical protein